MHIWKKEIQIVQTGIKCPLPPHTYPFFLLPRVGILIILELFTQVYICGGFNGNECLFTAEVYNTESNQWTVIAPMRSRRSGIGVIAYGEHVYAVSLLLQRKNTLPLEFVLVNGFMLLLVFEKLFFMEDNGRGSYEITGTPNEGFLSEQNQ